MCEPNPLQAGQLLHETFRSESSNLRQFTELLGWKVIGRDGELGHVANLIVETGRWQARYLVVSGAGAMANRMFLVAPEWIAESRAAEESLDVILLAASIASGPVFDASHPLTRSYESQLHEHYGLPPYWKNH